MTGSGAAGVAASSHPWGAQSTARVTAPENCSQARKGLRYYVRVTNAWRARMGTRVHISATGQQAHLRAMACARVRSLAAKWRLKAISAHRAFRQWRDFHWAWWKWLPYDWQARSRCELGYPLQPRSWRSNVYTSNGNFQGFVNFYNGTWDSFRSPGMPSEAYLATPREQYEVALAVARRVGLGAWQSCATP